MYDVFVGICQKGIRNLAEKLQDAPDWPVCGLSSHAQL